MAIITVDDTKKRFLMRFTNSDERSAAFSFPSRKWMSTYGVMVVPYTRANSAHLLKLHGERKLGVDPEIVNKAEGMAASKVGDRDFPKWFAFKTAPRVQQREALTKTYRNNVAALFMRMGTGKSKVIIDTASAHFYERRIQAVIIVCPLSVTSVWKDGDNEGQLEQHSPCPYEYHSITSNTDLSRIKVTPEKLTYFLVGIESLSQGNNIKKVKELVATYRCAIAVDEASRIKNHSTIRTKKVLELRDSCPIRLISTGTPTTKSLMDLFSLFEFLDPDIIGAGSYYAFRNRYAIMGGYKQKEVIGYNNVDELMGLIEPYTYICDKPEGMPPQIFAPPREIELTEEQKKLYRQVKKGQLEGVNLTNVLNRFLKLQQIVGGYWSEDPREEAHPVTGRVRMVRGPVHQIIPWSRNPKIKALLEIIDEIGDQQVIVWAKYLPEVEDIYTALCTVGTVAKFVGATENPLQVKNDFQKGKYKFFVGTPQKGGIGLTLTAASVMIYYSNSFSLEERLQSEDRMHRDGQKAAEVLYLDILAKGTVDRTIRASLREKKDLDQYVREKIGAAGNREKILDELMGDV